MLNKYENSLDTSDCLGNTQQDKILEQEKDTVTPTEHEEIYENDVTPPTGNHIINTVADLLLQPNAVIPGTARGTPPCLICKSLVQILPRVTRTIASRESLNSGFGFSINSNFPCLI